MFLFSLNVASHFGPMVIQYQYTYLRFHWQVDERSAFSSFDSAIKVIGLALFAPLANKVLRIKNINALLFCLATAVIQVCKDLQFLS